VVTPCTRSVSSRSGSADVLLALQVPIESGPEWACRCLSEVGLAFCFAPHFHPAMARMAALRRKLGVRTIFNLLGPLLNPASADYQLLGVSRPELLDPLAGALALLGVRQGFVVWSHDGLDEISLAAPTSVRRVRGGNITAEEWTAVDFGLEPAALRDLKTEGPENSAQIIRQVLSGKGSPARRVVLANAAAALFAAEQVTSLREGVARAASAIDSGRAGEVLERLRQAATE
jgi:anthranilate phosphoribosyltransferase